MSAYIKAQKKHPFEVALVIKDLQQE